MKKWFLVLVTTFLPVFAVSANAASVNPAELFKFFESSKLTQPDPQDELVSGPEFPGNALSQHREQFHSWIIAQSARRDAAVTPPSAVPLPAGVWLFGSALIALAGVARRRPS